MKERVRGGECVLITDVTCSWYSRLVIIVVVIVMVMTVMIVLGIGTVNGLIIKRFLFYTGSRVPAVDTHAASGEGKFVTCNSRCFVGASFMMTPSC